MNHLSQHEPFPGDHSAVQHFCNWGQNFLYLWEPTEVTVVLGRGSKAEVEVDSLRCEAEGVRVFRRRGGGGTVVLSPGVIVLTTVFRPQELMDPPRWLPHISGVLKKVLQGLGIGNLEVRGYGDLCIEDRKILGGSLHIKRDLILYQGSLLVSNDLGLIPTFLHHPEREPSYRQGRVHLDFITSLAREGYNLQPSGLIKEIARSWPVFFGHPIMVITGHGWDVPTEMAL